jgi:hypothetical protein
MEEREPPRQSHMPRTIVQENSAPARRTVYSKDPRVCKHQFGSGEAFCRYCATTNPNVRMSFDELGE